MMEIAIFKYDLTMISSSLWLDKEIHKEITGIKEGGGTVAEDERWRKRWRKLIKGEIYQKRYIYIYMYRGERDPRRNYR